MSMIDAAVTGSKRIEKILKDEFGAEGKGLHELLNSVEGRIPESLVKKARFIASVRNKVVHEDGEINDAEAFNATIDEVVQGLKEVLEIERRTKATECSEPAVPKNTTAFLKVAFAVIAAFFVGGVLGFFFGMDNSYNQDKLAEVERQLSQKKSEIATLKSQLHSIKSVSKLNQAAAPNTSNTKQPSTKQSSGAESELLKMASESGTRVENASAELKQKFVPVIKKLINIKTGKPSVMPDDRGTYTVRVPVTYSIPGNHMINMLSRYFSKHDGSRLTIRSERILRGRKNKIIISQYDADSPSSKSPLSKPLYDVLQGIGVNLVATVGSKTGHLVIAGNVDCHVSCSYSEAPERSWMLQLDGQPGKSTVSREFTTPILVKGVTKDDLAMQSLPTVHLEQVDVGW